MPNDHPAVTCTDCGATRSREPGPCPQCGSRHRSIHVGTAAAHARALPVTVKKVRSFIKRHPFWTATGVVAFLLDLAISLCAPALGPIVGTAATITLGIVGFIAGEKSTTLVREIESRPGSG